MEKGKGRPPLSTQNFSSSASNSGRKRKGSVLPQAEDILLLGTEKDSDCGTIFCFGCTYFCLAEPEERKERGLRADTRVSLFLPKYRLFLTECFFIYLLNILRSILRGIK